MVHGVRPPHKPSSRFGAAILGGIKGFFSAGSAPPPPGARAAELATGSWSRTEFSPDELEGKFRELTLLIEDLHRAIQPTRSDAIIASLDVVQNKLGDVYDALYVCIGSACMAAVSLGHDLTSVLDASALSPRAHLPKTRAVELRKKLAALSCQLGAIQTHLQSNIIDGWDSYVTSTPAARSLEGEALRMVGLLEINILPRLAEWGASPQPSPSLAVASVFTEAYCQRLTQSAYCFFIVKGLEKFPESQKTLLEENPELQTIKLLFAEIGGDLLSSPEGVVVDIGSQRVQQIVESRLGSFKEWVSSSKRARISSPEELLAAAKERAAHAAKFAVSIYIINVVGD